VGQTRNVLLIILITVAMAIVTSVLAYIFDFLVSDLRVFSKHLTYKPSVSIMEHDTVIGS
jgi:hypothetical protein